MYKYVQLKERLPITTTTTHPIRQLHIRFDNDRVFEKSYYWYNGETEMRLPGESDNISAFELSVSVGDKCIEDGLIFIDEECWLAKWLELELVEL